MEVTVTCPYCNSKDVPETPNEPGYITTCCNRVVAVSHWPKVDVVLYIPTKQRVIALGMSGDVSRVLDSPDSSRPQSPFTWVFADGGFYVVRLVPKFQDLEAAGRPWGLGLAQQFTSEHEAHLFADSVDKFLLQMISEFQQDKIRETKEANAAKVKPKYPPQGR